MLLATISALSIGCASGYVPDKTGPTTIAPAIITQPQSITVPMGLTGTFTASIAGNGDLHVQWSKNGVPIAGATSPTVYVTPATTFADTGAIFTVTASNSLGSVTSDPATLTIGARAPAAGDLRFQQVDAPSSVNGYGGGLGTILWEPGNAMLFSDSVGSPLSAGNACVGVLTCAWSLESFPLPSGAAPLSYGYIADYFTNYQTDLTGPGINFSPSPSVVLDSPNVVITGIDIVPADDLFGASWVQTTGGTFNMAQHTINLADLPADAATEGQQSRVITAITYNEGQVTYFSYGWQQDTTTLYETQTVVTPLQMWSPQPPIWQRQATSSPQSAATHRKATFCLLVLAFKETPFPAPSFASLPRETPMTFC